MSVNMKSSSVMLAGAAAVLLAGCASNETSAKTSDTKKPAPTMDKVTSDASMGQCHGVNTCKGQSACATASSACAGQNACKGKGWISAKKSDCDAKGGKFVAKK